jgi:hypothetical protein
MTVSDFESIDYSSPSVCCSFFEVTGCGRGRTRTPTLLSESASVSLFKASSTPSPHFIDPLRFDLATTVGAEFGAGLVEATGRRLNWSSPLGIREWRGCHFLKRVMDNGRSGSGVN